MGKKYSVLGQCLKTSRRITTQVFSETEIEARAKEILAVSCVRSDLIVIQLGTQINLFLSADLFAKRFIAF